MTIKESLAKVRKEFDEWADFRIATYETLPNLSEQGQQIKIAIFLLLQDAKLNLHRIIEKMEAE